MSSYNVNLPQTNFPMKASLSQREPKLLGFWKDIELYKKIMQNKTKKFILHDGPPYANGEIHLGHAVNKILKDIVNKSKLLDGFATPYVPGWDCHGLPIELNVEKKIGRVGGKVTLEEFILACQKYANQQIDLQRDAFIRLGVLGDFSNPYKTMSHQYEAGIIRALAKMVSNGYVVNGYKPVYWCTACGSALAEAEVEYINKTSLSLDVRFKLINADELYQTITIISVPIWTTTPWTLPANEAVALNAEIEYVLVDCKDLNEHLIVAKDLLESVMQRYSVKDYHIVKTYLGKELQGLMLQHPFLSDKKVPIVLGEHVSTDAGTGAVHTAPAHGHDDYKVGIKFNLPIVNPVDGKGCFLPDTPFFGGKKVFDANVDVVEILKKEGNLIHIEEIQHSYPHCWRHKTPLIYRATKQWFVDMDKSVDGKSLREKALEAANIVNWIPLRGKERIKDMVSNRPDWCISRQRFWGTPIALFIHKKTGELHSETQNLMEIVAQNVEEEGVVFWHKLDTDAFLKLHAKNYSEGEYEKVTDILDVWFESGVSHFCVLKADPLHQQLGYPADLYLEGGDQYRGWYQSSLLTACATNADIGESFPYRQVLTHGMTVDAEGRKMSKSLGNVIAPNSIIDTLGADILRLWIASTYIHDELVISEEILQRSVDAYRMLRNTARFLLGNLFDFVPESDLVSPNEMVSIDKFMVRKMLILQGNIKKYYDEYKFHNVCSELQSFISNDLSSFYFSVIKDRLYTMPSKSKGRRSAQTALFYILEILVRSISPVLSFTAEEIWQEMKKITKDETESVFLTSWYDRIKSADFSDVADTITYDDWELVRELRCVVNNELEKFRCDGKIGSSLAADVVINCGDDLYNKLQKFGSELRFVLLTSSVVIKKKADSVMNMGSSCCCGDALSCEGVLGCITIEVSPSKNKKCCRCWHYREDVGLDSNHPELCSRCVQNVEMKDGGEGRFIA